MNSTIQVRVEEDLKNKADALFKELGTDTTTAIRMFLTQAVAYEGFPFQIRRQRNNRQLSEEEIEKLLEVSYSQAKNGQFSPSDDVISEMRDKYGL